jgi:hypothetical protein
MRYGRLHSANSRVARPDWGRRLLCVLHEETRGRMEVSWLRGARVQGVLFEDHRDRAGEFFRWHALEAPFLGLGG